MTTDTNSAIYAGSFDPVTNGHVWMIQKAAEIFPKVRIVVAQNPRKKNSTMFSLEERVTMLQALVKNLNPSVSVETMDDRFLVDYAQKTHTHHIIRGIRSIADFEYEKEMNDYNCEINKYITSCYLFPPPKFAGVSSGAVKSLIGPAGWELEITKYLPKESWQFMLLKGSDLYQRLVKIGIKTSAQHEYNFWNTLFSNYNAPDRYHHNFIHIARMRKDHLEYILAKHSDDTLAMEVAIMWHDVINIPGNPRSEKMSADLAVSFLDGAPSAFIDKVYRFIMATQHSIPIDPKDKESALIIDLDLSILGKDEEIFDLYETNIRNEYIKYSNLTFARGRIDFLKKIAARRRIFTHPYFYEHYEKKARKNISLSIKRLMHSLK